MDNSDTDRDEDIKNLEPKSNSANNNDKSIESVAVRLPNFWTNSPQTWFIQADAHFSLYNVKSDRARYHLVIASLPQDVIETILDILKAPPQQEKYLNLKTVIIERLTISEEKRLEQLISSEQMGDKKPSEFYRFLKKLAGNSGTVSDVLLTKLWLRRLPAVVNVALISLEDRNITELSAIADRIFEASRQCVSVVNSTESSGNSSNFSHSNSELTNMRQDIRELQQMFKQFLNTENSTNNRNNFNFRSRSHSRDRRSHSRDRNNFQNSNSLCFYHKNFKGNANHLAV